MSKNSSKKTKNRFLKTSNGKKEKVQVVEAEAIEVLDVERGPEVVDISPATEDASEALTSANQTLPAQPIVTDLVPVKDRDRDSLYHYLQNIGRYPLLSEEQEKGLTKALAETGNVEVAKKLVLHNLRLVVKIAMEYKTAWQNVMDLIQEGNVGLMKAVSKYDPSKGAKLSYYASWWIKSYILKFILDNFRMVKIGTTNEQKKLFFNLMKEKSRLEAQGIKPDSKAISESLGVSEKAVLTMEQRLGPGSSDLSIDAPIDASNSAGSSFVDILPDEGMGPEEMISNLQSLEILKGHLKEFVAALKPRDRDIFKKRLLSEVPQSLQSIAEDYGVSRERIRQIEVRLMENLKVYMRDHIR